MVNSECLLSLCIVICKTLYCIQWVPRWIVKVLIFLGDNQFIEWGKNSLGCKKGMALFFSYFQTYTLIPALQVTLQRDPIAFSSLWGIYSSLSDIKRQLQFSLNQNLASNSLIQWYLISSDSKFPHPFLPALPNSGLIQASGTCSGRGCVIFLYSSGKYDSILITSLYSCNVPSCLFLSSLIGLVSIPGHIKRVCGKGLWVSCSLCLKPSSPSCLRGLLPHFQASALWGLPWPLCLKTHTYTRHFLILLYFFSLAI